LASVLAGLREGRSCEIEIVRGATASRTLATRSRTAWQRNIEADGLVLTGRYLDSITVKRDGDARQGRSPTCPTAPILEHGDSRQAAHPVAERAFDEHKDDAIGRIAEHIAGVLR
jgi:hypothetical protein